MKIYIKVNLKRMNDKLFNNNSKFIPIKNRKRFDDIIKQEDTRMGYDLGGRPNFSRRVVVDTLGSFIDKEKTDKYLEISPLKEVDIYIKDRTGIKVEMNGKLFTFKDNFILEENENTEYVFVNDLYGKNSSIRLTIREILFLTSYNKVLYGKSNLNEKVLFTLRIVRHSLNNDVIYTEHSKIEKNYQKSLETSITNNSLKNRNFESERYYHSPFVSYNIMDTFLQYYLNSKT